MKKVTIRACVYRGRSKRQEIFTKTENVEDDETSVVIEDIAKVGDLESFHPESYIEVHVDVETLTPED